MTARDRRKQRRWWAKRKGRFVPRRAISRRRFLAQGGMLIAGGALVLTGRMRRGAWLGETNRVPIRPPTASSNDATFRAACIGCGMCGTVCENGCIRYFAADEPGWGALTPYIDVRRRSCTLCMRCTTICPTNALTATADTREAILAGVAMGKAVVDPDRCLSYLGRLCGYCYDACPYPGTAIQLVPKAKPWVFDACVGCGRCVEACPQSPTAIDVARHVVS